MELVKIDKIDYFKKYQDKECYVFGKGPTFKVLKKNKLDFFCCVNSTINFIDDCDLLVCNDIESFDKIILNKLKNLKYILIPYYPHKNGGFNKNINYTMIINKIKNYFTGKLIVYNLRTSKISLEEYISLKVAITSSNTSVEFIGEFINPSKIYTYGIAILNSNKYNNFFKSEKLPHNYFNNVLLQIQNHIINYCKNKNISLTMS